MEIERAKILFDNYTNWLNQNGASEIEIIKGVKSQELFAIKTGEVDMAGSLWPKLDDEKIYIGGYFENRIIGATDSKMPKDDWRTMHMGLDFFAPAQTPIFAPFDGEIHSFKNNDNERDYGPCIILRHEIHNNGITNGEFFTLYGHLSLKSLEGLKIGQKFRAGDKIALLGARNENGGWPPHLHFQIILDMMGKMGDFDGLCRPNDKEFWQYICPSPLMALGLAA